MNVAEIISHHILDHDWGIVLNGFRIPVTTHTVTMFSVSVILLALLSWIAHRRKTGLLSTLINEYVLFIRDAMVLPNIGEEGRRFLPYFCTLFLFILSVNLAGMIPNMKTATSNISVTAALALCTGGLILYSGLKFHGIIGFLKGFIPSGTPAWLIPLIFPLEVVSTVIKVCVLAIRLFANMLSGHMVLVCLLLIVFIVGKMHIAAGAGALLPAMGLEIFMTCLELLVAFLQAYVFTLLTTIFVGSVIHTH